MKWESNILFSLLIGGLSLLLFQSIGPLQALENKAFDLRVYFQAPVEHEGDIILLNLAESNFEEWLELTSHYPDTLFALDLPKSYASVHPLLKEAQLQKKLILSHYYATETKTLTLHLPHLNPQIRSGFANYQADKDGILRQHRIWANYRFQGKVFTDLSFAWTLYQTLTGASTPPQALHKTYYRLPNQAFPVLTLSQFKALPATQQNKRIIIAGDMSQLPNYTTPYHSRINQLELHAHILEGWLKQSHFKSWEWLNLLLPFIMSLLACLVLYLCIPLGGAMTLGVSLTALLIYFSANTLLFGRTHIHLNLFAPLLAYSLSSLFIWIRYMQTEGKILRERFYSFRRQLPDETAKALMEQPESLINERKIVTVMFTDIRGFSRMGEMLPPDQIIQILNEYMTVMTDIVFDNKGTLDKYIGDGLMAVYGNIGRNNPKEDAYCAVKTALEMQEAMVHLQRKWMDQGMRPIQIRIGINTGDALVGYVGHPERKEMTVIGDTVNTTARIEKLNKQYHSQILISHSTYQYVKDTMEVHPIGKEKLKGKSSSVMVYEVKGWLEAHTH